MRITIFKNLVVILLSTWTLNVCGQVSGTTYQESKQSKKANFIYVYDNIASFAEFKDNQWSGLVVDLMKEFELYLKENEGIEVTTNFVLKEDFASFLGEVKGAQGGVFGLSNISITAERKRNYAFSPAYLDNVSLLLSSNGISTLSSLESISTEFEGMVAYSLPSSSYLRRLTSIKNEYFPDMEISMVASEAEIFEKLQSESNAFAIIDVNYYIEALKKKQKVKRHPVGDSKDDQFGILMPKNSDWEPLLREFFDSELMGSSRYNEIISNNLGSTALKLLESIRVED